VPDLAAISFLLWAILVLQIVTAMLPWPVYQLDVCQHILMFGEVKLLFCVSDDKHSFLFSVGIALYYCHERVLCGGAGLMWSCLWCCAVLSCDVLCCAVLCCAVLCCAA